MPASYVCETWSVIFRGYHGFVEFQDRILKKIFWPKKEDWARSLWNCTILIFSFTLITLVSIVTVILWKRIRWSERVVL